MAIQMATTMRMSPLWVMMVAGRQLLRLLAAALWRTVIRWLPDRSAVATPKNFYLRYVLPLERRYLFHQFHGPPLDEAHFDAKPMVLVLGQTGTGKTTFVRYLLGDNAVEWPTTDHDHCFTVLVASADGRPTVIPGHALVVDPSRPFGSLANFGCDLLSRLQCRCVPGVAVLRHLTLVDTPSGHWPAGLLEWFAERADRIVVLFDARTVDLTEDRFRRRLDALRAGHHRNKLRLVLNKVDTLDRGQLQRAYGALMWALGRELTGWSTPCRVYLGSFGSVAAAEQGDHHELLADLAAVPGAAALRKLDELVKRARLVYVHAHIIGRLQQLTESWWPWRREDAKRKWIANLDRLFETIQRQYHLSAGDFPEVEPMRQRLRQQDFGRFAPLDHRLLADLDQALGRLALPSSSPLPPGLPRRQQAMMAIDFSSSFTSFIK